MICVECGMPVNDVYHELSGGLIRVTRCVSTPTIPSAATPHDILCLDGQEYCKQVADKYVEHEFVIIFLDLILHRPQAYRHVLFNRLSRCQWLLCLTGN